MPAPTTITIIQGQLTVGTTSPPATAADCQIVSAALKANPKLVTSPATFCAGEGQVAAASGYELDITALQDWTVTPDGFSAFCFDNDGRVVYWELTLDGEAATPVAVMHGSAYCVAMDFGGDAGTPLQADMVWPVIGKPTRGPATAAAASSTETTDEPVDAAAVA
jgi:hypothetical protein